MHFPADRTKGNVQELIQKIKVIDIGTNKLGNPVLKGKVPLCAMLRCQSTTLLDLPVIQVPSRFCSAFALKHLA